MTLSELPQDLPGLELVLKGHQDLTNGVLSKEALLIMISRPEISRLGISLPHLPPLDHDAEHLLYRAIEKDNPNDAHSTYNSLLRRISSLIHCLDQLKSAA